MTAPAPTTPDAPISPLASRRLRLAGVIAGALAIVWIAWRALVPPEFDGFIAREQELLQTVVATGRVRADSRVRLGTQVTGTVSRVPVSEGDSVRANQLLIQLEDAELRAAVAQATAALGQAEASLDAVTGVRSTVTAATRRQAESAYQKAQADLARITRLHEGGAVSDDELERARQAMLTARSQFEIADAQAASTMATGADRKAAEAAVAAARAARDAARARLANASITAPAAGVVLTRSVEPGDLVQPGRVLMEVGIRSTAQLVVVPDERNLSTLAVGQRAMASADAFASERFPARVSYVSPAVDATQGTVEVRLQVDSVPAYLRPDMTVSVEIEVARKARALVIPLDAVRDPLSQSPWVLVRRNGRAERQAIRIGMRGEQFAEVVDGVQAGEVVVQPGLRRLEPGSRVRVRTRAEP